MFRKFLKCSSGSTSFEYAIIASLVSVAIVAGVSNAGSSTEQLFLNVDEKISGEE